MKKNTEPNQVDVEEVNLLETGLNQVDDEVNHLHTQLKRRLQKGTVVGIERCEIVRLKKCVAHVYPITDNTQFLLGLGVGPMADYHRPLSPLPS